jgi:hypothetical protein
MAVTDERRPNLGELGLLGGEVDPRPSPRVPVRLDASHVSRRHARELRRASSAAGVSLVVAGALAAVDPSVEQHIHALWSLVLAAGGLVVVAFAIRAPRPLRSGGLKFAFFLFGGVVSSGALVETGHALGILGASEYHAALAGAIGLPAAFLVTLPGRPFPVETRVVRILRFAAAVLVLAAAGLFFALGLGAHREQSVAIAPMVLVAVAGVALLRAGTRTPPLGWHRL